MEIGGRNNTFRYADDTTLQQKVAMVWKDFWWRWEESRIACEHQEDKDHDGRRRAQLNMVKMLKLLEILLEFNRQVGTAAKKNSRESWDSEEQQWKNWGRAPQIYVIRDQG